MTKYQIGLSLERNIKDKYAQRQGYSGNGGSPSKENHR